jgi:Tol biopolymer transport system component/predicted Ser/Thr protein kinase
MTAGTKLGPYEILAPIGAGGMGEVYRAKDTKLGREVAIKILPESFANDPDRLARFEREAKVLAALNHPNIAQIYGVEQRALVMELVEGETLKGALPLEAALNYAKQIADALEAAHEKGIVHRDLKPANIMITPSGVVKVLDFGLAKTADVSSTSSDPSQSPTFTISPTRAGVIMGTAPYMSPEQARGKPVDRRADIWAFGVVLYEMLTGRRLFDGETTSDILAAVLTKEPDLTKVPAKVRRLLQSCLQKDPKQRLQAIGDWRLLLESAPLAKDVHDSKLPWAVAAAVTIGALVLGYLYFRRAPEKPRVFKLSVQPPEKVTFESFSLPAVSPDGRRLAFATGTAGRDGLWVRDLDSLAASARVLPGTQRASHPFWSPDSRYIAFFADRRLKKIDVAGGPALPLCAGGLFPPGGTWSKNDVILFTSDQNGVVLRVPAAGGSAMPVTVLDPALAETSHNFPWFLPDGRHFLYTAVSTDPEKNAVYVGDLDSKSRHRILAANSQAVYAPPGYVLFLRERTLMAQPFDAGKAVTTGDPIPIAEQVDYFRDAWGNINTVFSSSQNGVLAYNSGGSGNDLQLTWFDRSGRAAGTVGAPGMMRFPTVSPDGNTVAADRLDPQTGFFDLWLHDLKRGTSSRFTFDSKTNDSPAWSPDGRHIAFRSTRDGLGNLYQKAIDGTAPEEALDKSLRSMRPSDWSRDGRYIIEGVSDPKTKGDIWVLPLFGDRKPFPYLQTDFSENDGKLSPNGQWLAYFSDETGRFEVYVQTFPTPGGKWQVSTNGGALPVWSRDGKELFFSGLDRKIMVAEAKGGAKFEVSVPKPLFEMRSGPTGWFDVSKDGRFLIPTPAEQSSVPITVVVNWTAGLKK